MQSITIVDAAFERDWQVLDSSSIKSLLIIMARAYKPMEFTIGYIIPLNLDTFLRVSMIFEISTTANSSDAFFKIHNGFT